jgi:hypothetical protein
MTKSPRLERRYRRLLAFYPKGFRRENEQEILSVLMAGAAEASDGPDWRRSPICSQARSSCGCDQASNFVGMGVQAPACDVPRARW